MDPYNQWGDEQYHQQPQQQQQPNQQYQQYQPESHEMNERAPINYNQNTYMTNDARETSVESLNIDSMQAKQHIDYNGQQPTKSYYHEMPQESNFWKYSEQLKSILAGFSKLSDLLHNKSSNKHPHPHTNPIKQANIIAFTFIDFNSRIVTVILRWNAYGLDNISSGFL